MTPVRSAPTLWAEEAPIETPWPALGGTDTECQFLVVGAGLAGLAIAGELARRGADVLVVDEAAPGAGASTRNAGFVLVAHAWEYPAMRERIGVEQTRAMIAIARRTHDRIERDFGASVRHRRCGTLMLPMRDGGGEDVLLERAAELLREDGVACEWVAPPSALEGFDRALSIPEDGEVHPGALVAALAREVTRGRIARIDAIDP
ncbi:MAG: FAD-binding oxidoreductase, partial [Myxococcota bacterium]|nr:FAD-binding oxidoreductase [Myxococcota bacterium]